MSRNILFSLLLALSFGIVQSSAQEISYPERENSTHLRLFIYGIEKIEGEVRIAVFNSKDNYTKDPIHAIVLPVDSTTIIWEEENLPFGEYAIAVYHDKNKNGKIDTNLFGIPKENYGFSNDARGKFGPASWEDSKFKVDNRFYTTSISIK